MLHRSSVSLAKQHFSRCSYSKSRVFRAFQIDMKFIIIFLNLEKNATNPIHLQEFALNSKKFNQLLGRNWKRENLVDLL